MKTHTGVTLLLMVVSFVAGILFQGAWLSVKAAQQASIAGQTLSDLSRAIQSEKEINGFYPDSIAGLNVNSEEGDFSEGVLREVTYFRTENGFIAFVGLPRVAYIHPGIGTHFK